MLYIIFTVTITVLIIYSIAQGIIILKYKRLNFSEKSFVAALTHDLKSPARAQINMLNLLLNGYFGKLNPQQYEMIKLTCSSSKYMANLVATVLTNYECETHSLMLNKKHFDIIKLINELLIQNQYLGNDKNLNIIFSPNVQSCLIYADKLQIERVINNLLSNAIIYSLNSTNIIIALNQKDDCVEFAISNKSNPISPKELKNIFQKFSKTNNSKYNKYSTGLGLYNAKRIIDLHHGTIYAKCSPDGICTFGFRLMICNLPANFNKQKV